MWFFRIAIFTAIVSMSVIPIALAQEVPALDVEQLYAVRIPGIVSSRDVAAISDELAGRGYSQVQRSDDGLLSTLKAGVFETAFEAEICREDLERRGFHRVSVVPVDAIAESRAQIVRRLPVDPIFALEAEHISDTPDPAIDMENDPIVAQITNLETLRTPETTTELETLAISLPEDDPRHAWALLRCAHNCRENGEWERALAFFQSIADGATPVRRVDRVNAMTRVAWIQHNIFHDRRRAFRAYRELELFSGSETTIARARTEQAGLVFEMVRHEGIGTWPEARRFCEEVANSIDVGDSIYRAKWRAVAQLMHLETYHYEERYTDLIPLAEAFLQEHDSDPARRRETSMARTWLGIAHYRLRQYDEAKADFEGIIGMELQPEENFADENIDSLSAIYLFDIAQRQGDLAGMAVWQAHVEENYPDRQEAEDLRRRLERALEEVQ